MAAYGQPQAGVYPRCYWDAYPVALTLGTRDRPVAPRNRPRGAAGQRVFYAHFMHVRHIVSTDHVDLALGTAAAVQVSQARTAEVDAPNRYVVPGRYVPTILA